MNELVKDGLWHIRQAIDDVRVHTAATQSFADFQRNLTTAYKNGQLTAIR